VARLLVYRGETLDRERGLTHLPFRIGRAPTNDLVLEDPLKSVSREHAEIRVENGQYVLVDRKSENGVWVAGNRRSTVTLDPAVVASIGPFRLKLEMAPGETVPAVSALQPDAVSTAVPIPVGEKSTQSPARTLRAPVPGTAIRKAMSSQTFMLIAAAVFIVVATGTVMFIISGSSRRSREAEARQMSAWIEGATRQIASGACSDALAQNIQPGLGHDPANTALAALKTRAEACLTAVPPAPTAPSGQELLASLTRSRELIAAGKCADALSVPIADALRIAPDSAEAQALKAEAEQCLAPPIVVPASPAKPSPRVNAARRVAPSEGGLEPRPDETDADYQLRVEAMRARYDEAVAAAVANSNPITIRQLEAIAREATPAYLDIASKITETRRAYQASAKSLMAEAIDASNKGRWTEAIAKFNQAREIDGSLPVDAEIAKANEAKLRAGREACTTARQRLNYGLSDAPQFYRRVLELLPATDPCVEEARRVLGIR
jgi:hypothetical protein